MRSMLRRLIHMAGNGRALDNARGDRDELARALAAVDALAVRVAATAVATTREQPLAA